MDSSEVPLYRQLYQNLRQAILTGRLESGTRLPSTRALATELSVSRNTVINAFEQLTAEGYLEGKVGAGTYISRALPDEVLQVRAERSQRSRTERDGPAQPEEPALSKRGAMIAATPVAAVWGTTLRLRPFRPGLPALNAFPIKLWERLISRRWRDLSPGLLSYGDPAGYGPLRRAVAAYLGAARGVQCQPEQVMIVAGAQQAIDLAARLLLDPGDAVWVENPGYFGARGVLKGANAQIVPVPVDAEGLNIEAGLARRPQARMVYITPSHQYPLGVTMSLRRRLALLEWAGRTGTWVLEDDYDSEYRYGGRPLAALQGLDQAGRVIYIGTFSKVLFPALRLGYLVAPPNLVDAFSTAVALVNRCLPVLEQAVLTDFITEGHFARHIRRMRTLYAERQSVLIEAAARHLPGLLSLNRAEAGMHVVGWLPQGVDEQAVAAQLKAHKIEAPLLSGYAEEPLEQAGLVLGYAAIGPQKIRAGVKQMAAALSAALNQ